MEEPGTLEVSLTPVLTTPKEGARSLGSTLELEYGTTGWWTSSLYLDGVSASGGPTGFTGYHLENRFRLLMNEHAVNPVFAAALFVVALGLAACRAARIVDHNPYAGRVDAVQAGAKLFRQDCAACHGANAEGRIGPPLATDDVRDRSDRELFTFITNGNLRAGSYGTYGTYGTYGISEAG